MEKKTWRSWSDGIGIVGGVVMLLWVTVWTNNWMLMGWLILSIISLASETNGIMRIVQGVLGVIGIATMFYVGNSIVYTICIVTAILLIIVNGVQFFHALFGILAAWKVGILDDDET